MKTFLFTILILLTCSSCWKKTEYEYNNVEIRLENLTGQDLTNISVGRRIYKVGGLRNVNYVNRWDNLKNNELTEFIDTKGQFLGYENFRGHIDGHPTTWLSEDREVEFLASGAFEDSWENPFGESDRDGLSLPEGQYTYQITLRPDGRVFLIDIIEE